MEPHHRRVAVVVVVVEAHHKRVAVEVVVGEGCERRMFLVEGNWGCLHRRGGGGDGDGAGGGMPWLKFIGGDDGGGGGGHCFHSQNLYRERMGSVFGWR